MKLGLQRLDLTIMRLLLIHGLVRTKLLSWRRDGRQVREQRVGQYHQDDTPDENPLTHVPRHVPPVQDGPQRNQHDTGIESYQGGCCVDASYRDVELGGELLRISSHGWAEVGKRL